MRSSETFVANDVIYVKYAWVKVQNFSKTEI